jgi:hypothetical protein
VSDQQSALYCKFGKHAAALTFSDTPGTLVDLLPEKFDGFGSPDTKKIARNPGHPQNKRYPALRGPIDLGEQIPLSFMLRGLSGNTGAAIDPESTNDLTLLLDTIFGTDSIDPAGAVTTATGGTGTTVAVTEMARFPVGTVIMFTSSSTTITNVRQVTARAGASGAGNLTVDRSFTGTADAANVVRAARWIWDPAQYDAKHGYFRAEWQNFARNFLGCMAAGCSFDFPIGEPAMFNSSWSFTDVADLAEANPTFSEQTTGNVIVNVNSNFWVGSSTFYVAGGLKLDLGGSLAPRKANSGPQGVQGYAVMRGAGTPMPKIMARLYRGVNSGEVADSTGTPSMNSLQAYGLGLGAALTGLSVAFQVGTVAGACAYVVASNATCVKAKDVVEDGFQCIDVEFECATPTANTSLYPVELHLL